EPPDPAPPTAARGPEVLLLSARSPAALARLAVELREHLAELEEWSPADVCATLARGRTHLAHRFVAVVTSPEDLLRALDAAAAGAGAAVPIDGVPAPRLELGPGLGSAAAALRGRHPRLDAELGERGEVGAAVLAALAAWGVRPVLAAGSPGG